MWLKIFLMIFSATATAEDLVMPKNANEISKILIKPATIEDEFEDKGFGSQDKGFDEIINDLPANLPKAGALIQFEFDSDKIQSISYSLLKEYATALNGDLKDAVLLIAGHTDDKGTTAYNLGLSLRRAQAVREFLISAYSVEQKRLLIKGFGEDQPISTNQTDNGRALNRRVEFIRLK